MAWRSERLDHTQPDKYRKPTCRVECDTWGDFLDAVQAPKVNGTFRLGSQSHGSGSSWAGTRTVDEALTLARDGWPEGRAAIQKLIKRLEVRMLHKIVKEDVNYDVEGMAFDVARYLTGEPEHWICTEESTMAVDAHRHVRIIYNITASCGIEASVIRARGAAVAALIELLEYAGHRVELWVTMATGHHMQDGVPTTSINVKVKNYDQHLDTDRVAFAVAHPAMLRKLGFAVWDSMDADVQRQAGFGYGYVRENQFDDNAIYLPGAHWNEAQWTSEESAETWIMAKLAAQGVVIRDD